VENRLEREGWVQRQVDPDDARSYHAMPTDTGALRLAEACVTHRAIIRTLFLDRLNAVELHELGAIWKHVLQGHASLVDDVVTHFVQGTPGAP